MHRPTRRLLEVSVLIGALAATMILAQPASQAQAGPDPRARKEATLVADNMTGAQVVPGPGDPDGFGTARLPNNSSTGTICWNINTELIDVPLTASLIHAGAAGQEGVVVLQLFGEVNNPDPSGCRSADPQLLRDLNQNSREFYLEISNFSFSGGAIRGQLRIDKS
jgi:hypothetical protein